MLPFHRVSKYKIRRGEHHSKIEKSNQFEKIDKTKREKDYVLKEAEMLVSSYISKLENNHEQKQYKTIKNSKKYIRLKRYAFLSSLIIVLQTMLLILK